MSGLGLGFGFGFGFGFGSGLGLGLVSIGPHLLEDVVQIHQLGRDHQARLACHLLCLGGDDALPAERAMVEAPCSRA